MTVRFNDLEQMEGMNSSWIRDLEVGTPIEDRPILPQFAQLETTNGSWIRDLEVGNLLRTVRSSAIIQQFKTNGLDAGPR
ncbi:unnamed protein product [Sphagnum jensenii]|uniref:Uncharacterized protein n=1 Tax=Sphagnum jensenii TaxID=128206 RepID=A0ABP1BPS4_9BRYO